MKLIIVLALVPFLSLTATDQVEFENKGVMQFSAGGGTIRCQGETKLVYPEFRIHSKGQLVQFHCASLSKRNRGQRRMDVSIQPRLGSIVAIGDVTVTLTHVTPHATVHCSRAVFVFESGSWLIDGEPWPDGSST